MATPVTVRSIDALPLELLQKISGLLEKEDILKLRLVAPRSLLPYLNSLVFENLIVDIDGTDDLPRWVEAEADGVVIKRIQEVATSRIADHVRVLTLRLTRPYSLSGYYEKLGAKRYPAGYVPPTPKPSLSKRISSIFRPKTEDKVVKTPSGLPSTRPRRQVDYTAELASALQALFKATDLVKTIRLVQPEGFNSPYDIVYASVYARILVRLFKALKSVDIPENVGLELLDCPLTHLLEAGLTLDAQSVSTGASKFAHLTLKTRCLGYAIIKPGTATLPNNPYSGPRPSSVQGFGQDLLKALCQTPSHFESFKMHCEVRDMTILQPCIEGKRDWSSLRHLEIRNFFADTDTFAEFTTPVIAQLETLILTDGVIYSKTSKGWRYILDMWIAVKESQPTQWSMNRIMLMGLLDDKNSTFGAQPEWQSVIEKLVPPVRREKMRRLT